MTALTHEQCQWLNLLMIFLLIFVSFAVGGYIIDRQEEKERKQQAKKGRRRRKHKYQRQWEDINDLYSLIGWDVYGLDKPDAICNDCEFQSDGRCFCTTDCFAVIVDNTQAVVDCSCYIKQECEKRQKNNYSEQHSE